MKTSYKIKKALAMIRPHINGHNTAIELFDEAIEEVKIFEKIKLIFTGSNRISKERKYEDT